MSPLFYLMWYFQQNTMINDYFYAMDCMHCCKAYVCVTMTWWPLHLPWQASIITLSMRNWAFLLLTWPTTEIMWLLWSLKFQINHVRFISDVLSKSKTIKCYLRHYVTNVCVCAIQALLFARSCTTAWLYFSKLHSQFTTQIIVSWYIPLFRKSFQISVLVTHTLAINLILAWGNNNHFVLKTHYQTET